MAFNVNELVQRVNTTGVAHKAHFDMVVTPPNILNGYMSLAKDLVFRIETSEFPGRSVQAIDSRYWGPTKKVPHQPQYQPVNIQVRCSECLSEQAFFLQWQDLITGYHRVKQNSLYGIGYYDDLVGTCSIRQYDPYEPGNNVVFRVELVEVYPSIVSPMHTGWELNELHRVGVTLNYRFFHQYGDCVNVPS